MADTLPVPETQVLAVASHVVSGNVGNKIAVFTLQSLGCEVSALNTVQFSNHTGYRQWTGSKVSAEEIASLYEGLKQSYLDDFDMMLSGYIPGAEAVAAVGKIGKELREKATAKSSPGSFFWVLDPVMGDNGRLYVAEEVVPAYQSLIEYADLILPNQFEAEMLSGVKITDETTLKQSIQVLHERYHIPHIIITSVTLPDQPAGHLAVVGSTMTSDARPRLFKIFFPAIDCYFSGTGDMFAALMTVRMRQAVMRPQQQGSSGGISDVGTQKVSETRSWRSPDDVDVPDLPLAKAAEMVVASMHEVLAKTAEGMWEAVKQGGLGKNDGTAVDGLSAEEKRAHLMKSKHSELKLVRNLASLRDPVVEYKVERM